MTETINKEVRILFAEKNNKVEILTLEELSQTVIAIIDIQKSRTTPVAHFEFIQTLLKVLENNGVKARLDHIYASNTGGTTPIRNIEEEKNCPKILESWLLKKITGKIELTEFGDNEMASCVAFSYHEKGIDLAYGQNVRDCSNMCIFGSNVLHTYGSGKNSNYETMIKVFEDWTRNIETLRKRDLIIIQQMKDIRVKGGRMLMFMGKLLARAAGFNMNMKVIAPLNVTQVTEVTRGILRKDPNMFDENNEVTLWDFYNFMTFVMKGDKADITSLLTDIIALGNMVIEEFSIQSNIEIIDLKSEE